MIKGQALANTALKGIALEVTGLKAVYFKLAFSVYVLSL